MSWLDPIFVDSSPANPTLVLCHSSTSVAMVRREIAKVGGVVGLAVMSPLGLARAIAPGRLIDDVTESSADTESEKEPSGDLWDRVVDRRGLRRLLLEHVDRAR